MGFWSSLFGSKPKQVVPFAPRYTVDEWKELPEKLKTSIVRKHHRAEEARNRKPGTVHTARSASGLSLTDYVGWKGFEDTPSSKDTHPRCPYVGTSGTARSLRATNRLTGRSEPTSVAWSTGTPPISSNAKVSTIPSITSPTSRRSGFHSLRRRYLAARKALAKHIGA